MELKQTDSLDRINFLREFTIELIYNITRKKQIKEEIEVEKIKQKFIKPVVSQKEVFEKISKSPLFKPSKYSIETVKIPEIEAKKLIEGPERLLKPYVFEEKKEIEKQKEPQTQIPERKPTFYLAKQAHPVQALQKTQQPKAQPQPQAIQPAQTPDRFKGFKPSIQQENIQQKPVAVVQEKPQVKPIAQIQKEILTSIKPVAAPKPTGLNLGKLEPLLRDPLIQSIECPGPRQNLLIKKYNKINSTQVTLTKEEMEDIITAFSMQARIPVVGGVLKAAVGDLLITAIISNVVESRFVISRIAAVQRTPIIRR